MALVWFACIKISRWICPNVCVCEDGDVAGRGCQLHQNPPTHDSLFFTALTPPNPARLSNTKARWKIQQTWVIGSGNINRIRPRVVFWSIVLWPMRPDCGKWWALQLLVTPLTGCVVYTWWPAIRAANKQQQRAEPLQSNTVFSATTSPSPKLTLSRRSPAVGRRWCTHKMRAAHRSPAGRRRSSGSG